VTKGADLLPVPDGYGDAPCSFAPSVEDKRSHGRTCAGINTPGIQLRLIIREGGAITELEALGLLGELLAPSAPVVPEMIAPGRIRRVLLGDRPVGGALHLRSDVPVAVPGPGAAGVAGRGYCAVAVLGPAFGGDIDAERDARAGALPAVRTVGIGCH